MKRQIVFIAFALMANVTAVAAGAETAKPTWTPEKCKTQAAAILKQGEACLPKAVYSERRACFWTIGPALPPGYFDGCQTDYKATMDALFAKDKAAHPKDCSAVTDNGTCKQPADSAKNPWTPEKCKTQAAAILKQGEACVPKGVYADRRACFWQIGPALPAGYFDSCQQDFKATMDALFAKDKSAHPKDCSAVTDNGTCKQGAETATAPSAGTPAKPAPDCNKILGANRAQGQKCMTYSTTASRASCINAVFVTMQKAGNSSCGQAVQQLTDELRPVEKAKWGKQLPSLE